MTRSEMILKIDRKNPAYFSPQWMKTFKQKIEDFVYEHRDGLSILYAKSYFPELNVNSEEYVFCGYSAIVEEDGYLHFCSIPKEGVDEENLIESIIKVYLKEKESE